jgi:hypothetical protein
VRLCDAHRTTALCTGRIDIYPERNCVTLTKWTNRQATPAKYGNSTREKVEASAAALKYDYHGVWEHLVRKGFQDLMPMHAARMLCVGLGSYPSQLDLRSSEGACR